MNLQAPVNETILCKVTPDLSIGELPNQNFILF
jgi:hypothetical protein